MRDGDEIERDRADEPPAARSYLVALIAGAVVVAVAAVVSLALDTRRPLLWTCAAVVIVVALLALFSVGAPFMNTADAGPGGVALSGKAGRDYLKKATRGYDAWFHAAVFALPSIGVLLLLWARS